MLDAMELLLIAYLMFFCYRLRQEVAALWKEVKYFPTKEKVSKS